MLQNLQMTYQFQTIQINVGDEKVLTFCHRKVVKVFKLTINVGDEKVLTFCHRKVVEVFKLTWKSEKQFQRKCYEVFAVTSKRTEKINFISCKVIELIPG